MAKPIKVVTPEDRVERWRKMWGGMKVLDAEATETAFEEFQDSFIPSHMQRQFLKLFGSPKAQFGNRYFMEDAKHQNWDTRLSALLGDGEHVDVVVMYGTPEEVEANAFRGERRRTLRDIVIDDWHTACAIVRAGSTTLYVFVEPKMRGCIVRTVRADGEPAPINEEPTFVEYS